MPRPSITWLTTDTHFFQDAIVASCNRPLDFGRIIQSNWRRLIAPQDLLIHLGDVIFYQYTTLKGMLEAVPCCKVLTAGNHDRKTKGWYMRNGFDFVCDAFTLDGVLFSHHPVEVLPAGASLNIHGHWHDSRFERPLWHTTRDDSGGTLSNGKLHSANGPNLPRIVFGTLGLWSSNPATPDRIYLAALSISAPTIYAHSM